MNNPWTNNNPNYQPIELPEFVGNPIVEALNPPPQDNIEAIKRLIFKPYFSPAERELPAILRTLCPHRLQTIVYPTAQHIGFFNHFRRQAINGHSKRNPMLARGQRFLHNAGSGDNKKDRVLDGDLCAPGMITTLTGLSGMGKSTLARACAHSLGKAVIIHTEYQGEAFTETQITYLMRNVPDQCSAKALCKSFGSYSDALLGKKFYTEKLDGQRNDYTEQLRHIIVNHHMSMLIIDEFQNLSLARSGGGNQIIAMLNNFRDELSVPILIVGTPKVERFFETELSGARRSASGGSYTLKRPLTPKDQDWCQLCHVLWDYQWVKNPPKPLNEEIINTFYDCSQGIPAVLITLFARAQIEAIETGTEIVDKKIIKAVYNEYLQPLHKFIQALRSRDEKRISQYEDLYEEGIYELNEDPVFAKMNEFRQEHEKQQKKEMVPDDSALESVSMENAERAHEQKKESLAITKEQIRSLVTGEDGGSR